MSEIQKNPLKTTPKNAAALVFKAGLSLAMVALTGVILLSGTWELTADQIAEQRRKAVLASLNQILPAERYDNAIQDDTLVIQAQGFFRHPDPITVFRARKQSKAVAVIMQITTSEGYNGDISLLVGIDSNGKVVGVRVTQHRETPGLGDTIDSRHGEWVLGFNGRSLDDPTANKWTVKRDGGYFDQFTGATISPRAVVKAVHRALEYEHSHRQELYQQSTENGNKTEKPDQDKQE